MHSWNTGFACLAAIVAARTGQHRTGQDSTAQDRAAQNRMRQPRTDRMRQPSAGWDSPVQDGTAHSRMGQDGTGWQQDGRTEQGRTAEVRSARGRTGRRGLRGRQHRHRRFCRISQHSALSYPRFAKRATGFCLPLGAQSIARVPQLTTKTTITIITGGDRTVSPMGAQTPSSGSSRRVLVCLAACSVCPATKIAM